MLPGAWEATSKPPAVAPESSRSHPRGQGDGRARRASCKNLSLQPSALRTAAPEGWPGAPRPGLGALPRQPEVRL